MMEDPICILITSVNNGSESQSLSRVVAIKSIN